MEVMIAMVIMAILATIAIPSYSSYVRRQKLSEGTAALGEMQVRMESYYQNTSNYGTGTTCGVTAGSYKNFTVSCALTNSGQGYTYTAQGTGTVADTAYTIDAQGNKQTNGAGTCWLVSGNEC
jgi:type IV pilus assembly protein PilE